MSHPASSLLGASLFKSAAFRLAALQAFLFALAALVLFLVSWLAARNYIEGQLRQDISDEAAEVAVLHANVRADAVRRVLARRPRTPFDYGLFERDHTLIAGDVRQEPAIGWSKVDQREEHARSGGYVRRMLVLATTLDDGRILVVGRDLASVEQLDSLLKRTFTWASLAVVLLALMGGMVTALSYLRRVEVVASAASRIAAGDLGARVAVTRRGDEFDRLAVSLNSMLERIQTLVEGMRQVSSDIAHDLRTPLTHLRQKLETAMQEATSIESYDQACERALADVDGVLETFSALLRITKVESRQRQAGFAEVALSPLLERLADDYRPMLEDDGRMLHTDIAPGVQVHGDALLLTQMVVNLIENALHHTPPGTPVRLKLEALDKLRRVIIEDAGPGIPAHERTRVLKRFVRLDAARTTPGNGLGLALVAAVADLHQIALTLADAGPGLRVQLDFTFPPNISKGVTP
ncbi:sensor histidine kinase [Dyella choica]|uniref:histidine kinase n=1 Tax=Dyella choica TaxID=1927959 RepID=A0A3S0WYV9_9GAMM|nr:ATP-binding protein [Dyella choica]RUL79994.1 HAMP domain-containing protein [Dyella choica]